MTLGTRGDVQAFVALARALDAAGHEAVVCGPHRFAEDGLAVAVAAIEQATTLSGSAGST